MAIKMVRQAATRDITPALLPANLVITRDAPLKAASDHSNKQANRCVTS